MKRLTIPSGLFILLIAPIQLICQNNAISLNTSYSMGKVDKRYNFVYDQYPAVVESIINKIDDNTADDEYAIGLGFSWKLKNELSIGVNLNYALLVQDFLLPVNGEFFKQTNRPFFWRNKSNYHIMQLSPIVQYLIIKKTVNAGVKIQAIGNISFRKVVQDGNLSRNKTEYFSNELYPGFFAEYKRFKATLGVRALNMKYRDDAIANNGKNPDWYNPFKVRLSLSYDLFRW